MESKTRENIKRKRLQRKRIRRIRFLRFLIFLVIVGSLGGLIAFAGYHIYTLGSHVYQSYEAMYAGYEQRQQEKRGMLDARFDGYTNVLVLGVDDGADASMLAGQHADTIMLLSLENTTGKVRVISIPRDTLVNIPGRASGQKLSAAFAYGGAPLTVQTVSALLGVSIHQYVTIDVRALTELVDLLGGIDLYVENDMDYQDPEAGLEIHLKKGYQHLDGDTAQKYLRYRSSELGDIGRVQRQQHFVKALYEQALKLDTLRKLPGIADLFQHRMSTSAEIFDSGHLANVLRHLNTAEPETFMLPGGSDGDAWIPDQQMLDTKIKELFPDSLSPAEEDKN